MNPVVGTAVLLLVVLMSTSASAGSLAATCPSKYPPTPCPGKGGWYQIGKNYCAKVFLNSGHLSFDDAERECQKERNGHLVSIQTQDELIKVMCTMYRVSTGKYHYWIGLKRDPKVHRIFKWTDGTGTSGMYSNFANGQPDDYWWREDCVEMNYWSWGLWNDEYCGSKRPFVCGVQL